MLENFNWKRVKALLSAGAILVTLSACRKPVEVEVTPTPTPSESVQPTQTKQPAPSENIVPSAEPSQVIGDIQPVESEVPTVEPTEEPSPVVTEKPTKTPAPSQVATPTPSDNGIEIVVPTPSGDVVVVIPPSAVPSEVPTATPTANPETILLQNEAKNICAEVKKLIDESIYAKDKIYKNLVNTRNYYNEIDAKFKELKAIQAEVNKSYEEATGTAKNSILKEKQKVDAEVEKVRQELENIANVIAKLVEVNQQYSQNGKINDFTNRNNVLQNNIPNITDASQLNDYKKLLEEAKEYAATIKAEKTVYDDKKQSSVSTKVEESLKTAISAKDNVAEAVKKQNSTSSGRRPTKPVTPQPTDQPVDPQPTDQPVDPQPTDQPEDPQPTDQPVDPQPTDKPVDPQPTEPAKEPDTTFDEDGNPDNIYGYIILEEGPVLKLTM